ncbi:MAG TPA: hypothetical protein VGV12_13355 [Gemmatimonadales bacterium]|nr:hypothetical protein [Gemmatimonadales bacterium]
MSGELGRFPAHCRHGKPWRNGIVNKLAGGYSKATSATTYRVAVHYCGDASCAVASDPLLEEPTQVLDEHGRTIPLRKIY